MVQKPKQKRGKSSDTKTIKTKEVILNSAEEVFAMQGYGGARTAEIASRAGVNKALIHYYFSNKERLYHAVMDRLLFELVDIAQDVLRRGLTGKKLIEGLFDAFFDYAKKHRHFARLTTVESAGQQSSYLENTLRNFFKPLFHRASEFLKTEAKTGKIARVDAEHFIITMYLAIQAYFSDSRLIGVLLGRDATAKKVLADRKKALTHLVQTMLRI